MRVSSPYDQRTLRFRDYMTGSFGPPTDDSWAARIRRWRSFATTCEPLRALGHLAQVRLEDPTDLEIAAQAELLGDDCSILDALKSWGREGRIAAFAKIDATDRAQVFAATQIGGVVIGCRPPRASIGREIWSAPPTTRDPNWIAGSGGSLAVAAPSCSAGGMLVIQNLSITHASWKWIADYVDEAWTIVWDMRSVDGVDVQELIKDSESL